MTPPPPVRRIPGPMHLAPGEVWCRRCGNDGTVGEQSGAHDHRICTRCGSKDLVPAVQVLRPGEYVVVGT